MRLTAPTRGSSSAQPCRRGSAMMLDTAGFPPVEVPAGVATPGWDRLIRMCLSIPRIPGMCTIHANSAREAITKMCGRCRFESAYAVVSSSPIAMTSSTSASTSSSRVRGLMKHGRIARRPPTVVDVGIDRVVRRSRNKISAFTASSAA